jgi:phage I-like protein
VQLCTAQQSLNAGQNRLSNFNRQRLFYSRKPKKESNSMKKSLITLLAITGLAWALASVAYAGEEKTITGEAKCAKCILKETDSCQNAVQVKENGKTITYLLTKNDVSKKFHENVCTESKKVKVTGTVKEVAGKFELTPTKIDLVKD